MFRSAFLSVEPSLVFSNTYNKCSVVFARSTQIASSNLNDVPVRSFHHICFHLFQVPSKQPPPTTNLIDISLLTILSLPFIVVYLMQINLACSLSYNRNSKSKGKNNPTSTSTNDKALHSSTTCVFFTYYTSHFTQ
jgi:hypothetical protein